MLVSQGKIKTHRLQQSCVRALRKITHEPNLAETQFCLSLYKWQRNHPSQDKEQCRFKLKSMQELHFLSSFHTCKQVISDLLSAASEATEEKWMTRLRLHQVSTYWLEALWIIWEQHLTWILCHLPRAFLPEHLSSLQHQQPGIALKNALKDTLEEQTVVGFFTCLDLIS